MSAELDDGTRMRMLTVRTDPDLLAHGRKIDSAVKWKPALGKYSDMNAKGECLRCLITR